MENKSKHVFKKYHSQKSLEFDSLSGISSIFEEITAYFAKQNRSFKKYFRRGALSVHSLQV